MKIKPQPHFVMTPFSEIDINDGNIFEVTPDFLNINSDREDDEDIDII